MWDQTLKSCPGRPSKFLQRKLMLSDLAWNRFCPTAVATRLGGCPSSGHPATAAYSVNIHQTSRVSHLPATSLIFFLGHEKM